MGMCESQQGRDMRWTQWCEFMEECNFKLHWCKVQSSILHQVWKYVHIPKKLSILPVDLITLWSHWGHSGFVMTRYLLPRLSQNAFQPLHFKLVAFSLTGVCEQINSVYHFSFLMSWAVCEHWGVSAAWPLLKIPIASWLVQCGWCGWRKRYLVLLYFSLYGCWILL